MEISNLKTTFSQVIVRRRGGINTTFVILELLQPDETKKHTEQSISVLYSGYIT